MINTRSLKHLVGRLTTTPMLLTTGYFGLAMIMVLLLRASAETGDALAFGQPSASESGDGVTIARPTLTFIFNVRDCPGSRRLVSLFNDLHESGRAGVTGFLLEGPRDSLQLHRLLTTFEIRFPVSTNPDEIELGLKKMFALGYKTTPWAILTDRKNRPRLILPPVQHPAARSARIAAVTAALHSLELEERNGYR